MTVVELLERARSQVGLGTHYRLGGGKTVPVGADCRDEEHGCDCSAFLCWCLRISKYQGREMCWLEELNGGWVNTDGMYIDAIGNGDPFGPATTGYFSHTDAPEPGCVVVYPSKRVSGISGPKVGHCGIVSAVNHDGSFEVIHCSAGNDRAFGDAIQETDAQLFTKHEATVFAWPSSVKHA